MDARQCPKCNSNVVVAGRFDMGSRWFEPSGMRFFRFWGRGVSCPEPFRACLACGLVWAYCNRKTSACSSTSTARPRPCSNCGPSGKALRNKTWSDLIAAHGPSYVLLRRPARETPGKCPRGTSDNGGYDRSWQTLPIVPPATPMDWVWLNAIRAAWGRPPGCFRAPSPPGRMALPIDSAPLLATHDSGHAIGRWSLRKDSVGATSRFDPEIGENRW